MKNNIVVKFTVYTAILSTIAIILNYIEIPYIIPWLKIEISDVISLIGVSMSLFMGVLIAIFKALFMTATGSTSGFIGEITLLVASFVTIIPYYFFNKKFSEKKSLFLMSIIFCITMVSLNYFFITPFYLEMSLTQAIQSSNIIELFGKEYKISSYFLYIIILYLPYNMLKIFINSVIFYNINKKLKKVIDY